MGGHVVPGSAAGGQNGVADERVRHALGLNVDAFFQHFAHLGVVRKNVRNAVGEQDQNVAAVQTALYRGGARFFHDPKGQ